MFFNTVTPFSCKLFAVQHDGTDKVSPVFGILKPYLKIKENVPVVCFF